MTVGDGLLLVGLILFAILGGSVFRTVKARDISGIVIMGDVKGDVTQHQAQKPPEPPKPPWWRGLLTLMNAVLGIVAAVLVIAGFLF